ncbi:MAG: alpha-amylase [Paludibacteraceae bacterium]|nr:alpha-amylase [Paludibacteraceae bacterium]
MAKHIIYQLLPRLFTNYNESRIHNGSIEENGCGKFNFITDKALRSIQRLGVTHIWYTGILEHATQTDYSRFGIATDNPSIVKGKAGSPYAVKDYYDVDPDLAEDVPHRMEEFEALVERTHARGLKVIIDFVANHVAREYKSDNLPAGEEDLGAGDNPQWAFSPLNNFYYIPQTLQIGSYTEFPARATGNDCFHAYPNENDWYETVKLNYGVFYQGGGEKQFLPIPKTWHQMLNILKFWCAKGIDAFRCDMAEMVPVEFWKWAIKKIKDQYPQTEFLAEVYNPYNYRDYLYQAGFDYLYDKVGMYDYLRGVVSKSFSAEGISNQWQATDDIREHMLYFLENHDEQRIASGFFCGGGAYAEPAMIVAATLGTNPLMIYSGQELGEKGMDIEGFSGMNGRTTIFDYWGVRSIQAWANHGKFDGARLSNDQKELRNFYSTLLNLCTKEKAVKQGKMYDLQYAQADYYNKREQYCFLRKEGKDTLLVIVNFADRPVDLHVIIPQDARDYLCMPLTDFDAVDLLSGEHYPASTDHVDIHIEAWKGKILKFKC